MCKNKYFHGTGILLERPTVAKLDSGIQKFITMFTKACSSQNLCLHSFTHLFTENNDQIFKIYVTGSALKVIMQI